jgi:hypothetical protein
MSRLFQRLVSQATGAAPRVRAAAGVRVAEPLAGPLDEPDPSPALSAAAGARRQPGSELASEQLGANPFGDTDTAAAAAPIAATPNAGVPSMGDESPPPRVDARGLQPPIGRRSPGPTRLVSTHVAEPRADESEPGETRPPSLLLASPIEAGRAAAGLWHPRAALEPRAATERDSEPSEVHVHIGRIEIRAETAPAPARGNAVPARKSPALADYLAKRQRRAP